MKKKLIIIGAGGHGRAVAEAATLSEAWGEIVFIDDAYPKQLTAGRWAIIANTQAIPSLIAPGDMVVVAIGNQTARKRLFNIAQNSGASMATVIHPRAWVSGDSIVESGVTVMAGAIVGNQAKIGMGAIVNANATVDHDVVVGRFAHLGVGVQLAGGVVIGEESWLQAGTCAGYRVHVAAGEVVAPGTALSFLEG